MSSTSDFISGEWDKSVVPLLTEYIKIPNQSPEFDPEWHTNGLLDEAMALLTQWAAQQPVQGMSLEVIKHEGKTPFCFIKVEAFDGTKPVSNHDASAPTILMYGHMDKQPPISGWDEGLGPYTPVLRGDRLYGRGGADDGYAICASLLSIIGVQRQGKPHARISVIIEASEESDDTDLPYYIDKLKDRFGNVSLVICLDSGALSYDRLWLTSSLRGVMSFTIKVELLKEDLHSGLASGAVADTFRVMRVLLERIEDMNTGECKLPELFCEIPKSAVSYMQALHEFPREEWIAQWPRLPGVQPLPGDNVDLALNVFWRPQLTVVGADGFPPVSKAGNILRKATVLKCSLRLPPLTKRGPTLEALRRVLTTDVPYNASVTVDFSDVAEGWCAPPLQPWLEQSLTKASVENWGRPFAAVGLGGSIPFMGMLGEMFPMAQFVVTGVLGPNSNAHGPNEFLDIPFAKRVNASMVHVIEDHYNAVCAGAAS